MTQVVVTEVRTVEAAPTAESTPKPKSKPKQVSSASSAPEASDGGFSMPNEVGKGLQEAQDHMQAVSGNPVFFTSSTDASGQGRSQIVDSNWKVCEQNVPPGTPVDESSDVSFAAVKLGEDCP